MPPLPPSSIRASGAPPPLPSRSPPPPPPPPNRFRKDPRLADFYEQDIAPLWTEPFGRLLLSELETVLSKAPAVGKDKGADKGSGKAASRTVLDVICHSGYPGLEILNRHPETRLVAIDPSSGLLDIARSKAGALVGRRVFFRTESAEPPLPFDESVYDLVVSNLGLYDAAQPRLLLRELVRVAKPGAGILATLPLRGSFAEFYALLASLVQGRPRETARLDAHLGAWPDAGVLLDWAADAGLVDVSIVVRPFSLLVAGGTDLFFAPVIEYGPLSAWKNILGDSGPEMQAAFNELRARVDAACEPPASSPELPPRPFVLTVRAACLRARKPAPAMLPTFEEDPENAPTRPGS